MQESPGMLNLLTREYDLIPSTFANETGVNIISKLFEGPIDPLIAIYEQLATFSQSVKFTEPNRYIWQQLIKDCGWLVKLGINSGWLCSPLWVTKKAQSGLIGGMYPLSKY